jgi:hypothetical protein
VNIRQERAAAARDHPVDTGLRLSAEITNAVTNPAPGRDRLLAAAGA